MRNRASLTGGLILIFLGIAFLFNQVFEQGWPFLIIGLGAAFLISGLLYHNGGLMIPGAIQAGLGLILLYQANSHNWVSWLYLWPLVPAAMGIGMVLSRVMGIGGNRYLRVAISWTLIPLAMAVFFWYFRDHLIWPTILVGIGTMFILVALFSAVMPQAIPGVIILGLGLLLGWQNLTGNWSSWAYTWTLLPAFVGLGLFVSFLRHRTVRTVGLYLMGWSLVAFAIFGMLFGGNSLYTRFWPLSLVLVGLMLLAQSLTRKPQPEHG
jgi:hypothetical protein